MKIYQKLLCGFLAISFLPMIVSYVTGLVAQENIINNFQEVGGEIMPDNIVLARMTAELYHALLLTTRYAEQGNIEDRREIEKALSTLNTYKTMHMVYKHGAEVWHTKVYESIQRFSSYITEYILLIQKDATKAELNKEKLKINRLLDDFVLSVDPYIKDTFTESLERFEATKQETFKARKLLIGSNIIILMIAFGLSLFVSRLLSRPITELRDAALAIGKGRLDVNLQTTSKDEIGELAHAFNEMAMNLSIERSGRSAAETNEAKIKEIADKLQKSNSELQEFFNIASHDLQEPLRKVIVFGNRLKGKYTNIIDERGRDYINGMQNSASRMQTLIDSLLEYSHVISSAKPFAPADLSAIVQEVLSNLEVRIGQVNGQVVVGDLAVVEADPLQMRQLFQNLTGNALKFNKKDVSPIVKISGRFMNGNGGSPEFSGREFYEITVEDNGIGFHEQYADRIFGVFQRLHGKSEYEGMGIGLSICKKIVVRHNGSITTQSSPGEGAKFIVTLPVKQQEVTASNE